MLLLQNFMEGGNFVLPALIDVLNTQVARTQGHGLRDTFGDDGCLQSTEPSKRESCAVVGVKSLGFEHGGTGNSEADLVGHFVAMFLDRRSRGAAGRGKQKNGAVGHDAVDVEDDEFDLAGAFFRHEAILARRCSPRVRKSTRREIAASKGVRRLPGFATSRAGPDSRFRGPRKVLLSPAFYKLSAGSRSKGPLCRVENFSTSGFTS